MEQKTTHFPIKIQIIDSGKIEYIESPFRLPQNEPLIILDRDAIVFEPRPDYGTLYTLEEFIGMVTEGGFIDYDGFGYFAIDDQMSNRIIFPSDIKTYKLTSDYFEFYYGEFTGKNIKFTHVVWFNR